MNEDKLIFWWNRIFCGVITTRFENIVKSSIFGVVVWWKKNVGGEIKSIKRPGRDSSVYESLCLRCYINLCVNITYFDT